MQQKKPTKGCDMNSDGHRDQSENYDKIKKKDECFLNLILLE